MKNKIDRWDISLTNLLEIIKTNLKKEYVVQLYDLLYELEFSQTFKKDGKEDIIKNIGGMKITYKYQDTLTLKGNELVSFEDTYLDEVNKYDTFIENYQNKLKGFSLANLLTFQLNLGEQERLNKKELLLTALIKKEVFKNCTLDMKRDFKSFIILLENYYTTYSLGKYVEQESIEKIIKKELLASSGIRGRDELLGVINIDYYEMVRLNNDELSSLKENEVLNKNKKVNSKYLEEMIKYVSKVQPYKKDLIINIDEFKNNLANSITQTGLDLKKDEYVNELLFGFIDKKDLIERVVKNLFQKSDLRTNGENVVSYISHRTDVINDEWKRIIEQNLDSMQNINKYLMYYYLIRDPNNIFKRKGIGIYNSSSEEEYEPQLNISNNKEKSLVLNSEFEIFNGYRFKNNSEHLGLYFRNLEKFLARNFIEHSVKPGVHGSVYEIVLKSYNDNHNSKLNEEDLILTIKEVIKSCVNIQNEDLEDILNRVEKIKMQKDMNNLNISKQTKKIKF